MLRAAGTDAAEVTADGLGRLDARQTSLLVVAPGRRSRPNAGSRSATS
jgi:hypothetical protein